MPTNWKLRLLTLSTTWNGTIQLLECMKSSKLQLVNYLQDARCFATPRDATDVEHTIADFINSTRKRVDGIANEQLDLFALLLSIRQLTGDLRRVEFGPGFFDRHLLRICIDG